MPKLDRVDFKHNAKVFEKNCVWCGVTYYASRSTAKYCSSTCRSYAHQAQQVNEAAPWQETEKTVDALLTQIAYLKGQLTHYIHVNQELQEKIARLENTTKNTKDDQ